MDRSLIWSSQASLFSSLSLSLYLSHICLLLSRDLFSFLPPSRDGLCYPYSLSPFLSSACDVSRACSSLALALPSSRIRILNIAAASIDSGGGILIAQALGTTRTIETLIMTSNL